MRIVLFLVSCAVLSAGAPACTSQQGVVLGFNKDIGHSESSGADECCQTCDQTYNCKAWTYISTSKTCYTHYDSTPVQKVGADHVSGLRSTPAPPPGPAPPSEHFNPCVGDIAKKLPYCDPTASLTSRLKDLTSRIKLSDAPHQLTARESPELSDIQLPSYYWGTNAIHGVQDVSCIGDKCPTSFPAPCGLAAAFNDSIVKGMGDVIGTELRAYWNAHAHNSLDTWSPTININRDPRWGRNVESPGEDPLVSGRYGSAYLEGLQRGPEYPRVVKAVVTLKHWFAYSLENYDGHTRYNFDAKVSAYDLASTYWPAWEMTVRDNKALGIMCSYNSVNGVPTCANSNATKMLREDWGFEGYITSDSDSCGCIWKNHKWVATGEEAAAACVKGGCDIDSGSTYIDYLDNAVNAGLITRDDINNNLERSYKMRYLTGTMDPTIPNSYRNITVDVLACPEHVAQSKLAARQSLVLLKNTANTLPFSKGQTVAVIGQSSNSTKDILGNYLGPMCPNGKYDCIETIFLAIEASNGGTTALVDNPSKISDAVAAAKNADYVVLTISNAGDGGSEGSDRKSIALAADQEALAKAVLAVGKPTVLVMINGGIIAIDELSTLSPAIIEAWMPGQFGAAAVADAIFGDYNPGGKMPVTLYHSNYINEVDFLNMSMADRSYRYYTGKPLYEFGFGLSYTNFTLSWSPSPRATLYPDSKATTYTCTVKNIGKVAGDEVVLAFYKPKRSTLHTLSASNPVPIKQLFDYKRVSLAPGASTTVSFTLDAATLALVDEDGHTSIHAGQYDIILSRGHGDVLTTTANVATTDKRPHRLKSFRKWW